MNLWLALPRTWPCGSALSKKELGEPTRSPNLALALVLALRLLR
jgi:hypothetical protein